MNNPNSVSIITIGNELLSGSTIDSNSVFLSKELLKLGFVTKFKLCIGDTHQDILNALSIVDGNYTICIITGGLGPTSDDITKKVLSEFFDSKLIQNDEILKHLQHFAVSRNTTLTPKNIELSYIPDNCTPLKNPIGTAYGMLFQKGETTFISLPGVPAEVKEIFDTQIIDRIKNLKTIPFYRKDLTTFFINEPQIAEQLEGIEKSLNKAFKLAYLPSVGYVKLNLTCQDQTKNLESVFLEQWESIKQTIQPHMLYEGNTTMEQVLFNLLMQKKYTISCAESCTGGAIASLMTKLDGVSKIFKGSLVCYDNRSKNKLLNVPKHIIDNYGAVSRQCAEIMATNICSLYNTDIGVATTGYLGKDDKTISKELKGNVFIAVKYHQKIVIKQFVAHANRSRNIEYVVNQSVIIIISLLNGKYIDK